MPKLHKDFPAQLSLGTTKKMHQELQAIGYMMGIGGQYAGAVRNLLQDAIYRYVSELDPRKKSEYDQILASVKSRDIIKE